MDTPSRKLRHSSVLFLALSCMLQIAKPQAPKPSPSASAEQGIRLVEKGRCNEAIPLLKKSMPHVVDKQIRYHAGMALARCGMGMMDSETAISALMLLQREFPDDPEVLYISTHYFSELGARAAQELAAKAPDSFQAQKLQAESLESQGKNSEASAIYESILTKNPQTPGIHYRLGQILLAEAGADGPTDAAKAEFIKETEVDPLNAAAEFILGELDRRAGQWDTADQHFSRAIKIDAGFSEAYLALGMSLNASGNFAAAVAPLEQYVKLQPDDPAGHYQLAMAYRRTGNQERAAQEIALQAKAAANSQHAADTTEGHAVAQ